MKALSTKILLGVSLIALATPFAATAQTTVPVPTPTPTPPSTDTAAVAEQAAAQTGIAGQDIIVTARRRDESVQDVPAVVNAVTAAEVGRLNFRTFNEVQAVVPGLTLSNLANGTGGNAQLRGVNFDINASGNNPTVEFYFDDAPITAGVILQELYDVGQIEVLRGPQGTLRGRASPSGSITVTSRKPDLYTAGGNVSLTGNDIGTLDFTGGVGIPIIPGIAAIRVAGAINESDFDRVRTIATTGDRRDPYSETRSGRVSAIVQPFDALKLEGTYERLDHDVRAYDQIESFSVVNPGAPASPVLIRAGDRLSNEEDPRIVRQVYNIYNGRAELGLFGQRLIYQFQRYTQAIDSTVTVDQAEVLPNYNPTQVTSSRPVSVSHEVRLQNDARVLGIFDYVLGGFDDTNDTPTNVAIQTPVFLPPALGGGLVTTAITNVTRAGHSHEQSVFGNITAHIGSSTQISGGARYIHYTSTGALIVAGNTIPDPSIDVHRVIYTASVQHNFTPNLMLYASTGTSFRPGINAVGDFSVNQSAREKSFLNLPAETSQSYEAGFKSTLFDGRGHLNVSGFHQNFTNYPFRVPNNGVYYLNYAASVSGGVVSVTPQVGQFNFVAAVPVTVNGAEGEFNYDVAQNLNFALIGSYALGKIKGGTTPCNDLNGDGIPDATSTTAPTVAQLQAAYGANNIGACKVNQRSSFQPPFSASVRAEYTLPISDRVDSYVRGLFSYYGKSQGDPQNTFDDVGSYGLLNMFLGIRDPKGTWEINLFAKNLLDEVKVLTRTNPLSTTFQVLQPPTFRTTAATTVTGTYTGISTTPPREFGVNLRFAFGSR